MKKLFIVFFILSAVAATKVNAFSCVDTFNSASIQKRAVRSSSGAGFVHMGFPDIVRYKGSLFIAYREASGTQGEFGSHFFGPSVIVILKQVGRAWREVARIDPPSPPRRPPWPSTVFDDEIYQTDDIRDFTFSKTGDGRLAINLGVVNSRKRVNRYEIEKIQLSAVTFSKDGENWNQVKFADSPHEYMMFNTKLYRGRNYGFAYLNNYILDNGNLKNFNQGGVILLSSANGVNYSLLPGVDTGTLIDPYLQQVVLSSRVVDGERVFFETGANETDLHIYPDGSAIVIARVRDREEKYYVGLAQNIRGPWSFTQVQGVGLHAPDMEVLPSGKVIVSYRRVSTIGATAVRPYNYCTVISELNPVSGVLRELVSFAGPNTLDIGYTGMIVDGNNLLITYHEVQAGEFPTFMSYHDAAQTSEHLAFKRNRLFNGSSKIFYASIPLTEIDKKIGALTGVFGNLD